MDYEARAQPKTALPAQLDLVQVQQHENILCFGALVEISLMKNTLDLILRKLVIYYKAMEVKETCSLHLFNKKREKLSPLTVLTVLGVFRHTWTKIEKIGRLIKNTNMFLTDLMVMELFLLVHFVLLNMMDPKISFSLLVLKITTSSHFHIF